MSAGLFGIKKGSTQQIILLTRTTQGNIYQKVSRVTNLNNHRVFKLNNLRTLIDHRRKELQVYIQGKTIRYRVWQRNSNWRISFRDEIRRELDVRTRSGLGMVDAGSGVEDRSDEPTHLVFGFGLFQRRFRPYSRRKWRRASRKIEMLFPRPSIGSGQIFVRLFQVHFGSGLRDGRGGRRVEAANGFPIRRTKVLIVAAASNYLKLRISELFQNL